jgi:hypothetical protein
MDGFSEEERKKTKKIGGEIFPPSIYSGLMKKLWSLDIRE